MTEIKHQPVLLAPVMEALKVQPGGTYLDATVGLGGHAVEILRLSAPDGHLYGIDRDPQALERARERLAPFGERARLFHGNYARLDEFLPPELIKGFDGALADLGVSSLQLMEPARGFSFQQEGPLDMRMDPTQAETALSYLKRALPDELEERLREAGEERFAKRLVSILLKGREEWRTTRDLAEAVARAVPRRGKSHPATRVFMALRMAVNQELEGLRLFLRKVPTTLKPGGRLAVISFHSSEDRIVKRFTSDVLETTAEMRRLTKSPLIPKWEERKSNPRSRSAKLRVFEKKSF